MFALLCFRACFVLFMGEDVFFARIPGCLELFPAVFGRFGSVEADNRGLVVLTEPPRMDKEYNFGQSAPPTHAILARIAKRLSTDAFIFWLLAAALILTLTSQPRMASTIFMARLLVVIAVSDALQIPVERLAGRQSAAKVFGYHGEARLSRTNALQAAAAATTLDVAAEDAVPHPGPLSIKIGGKSLNIVGILFALAMTG